MDRITRRINRNGPIPLYYQLREIILEAIERKEFMPAAPLPTEDELMKRYEVSRTTVREALRGLTDMGIIIKKQGVGSFVAEEKISEFLPGLVSFSQEMKFRGFSVRSELLDKRMVPARSRVATALAVSEGHHVLRITR
ncbi:MAG TPA: GntR family transcriptional regulator, partial [Anaerolineales bacterium]